MPRDQEVAITTNGRVMNPYREANIKISNDQFHREEGTINDKWFTAQELYSDLIWIDNEDISSRSVVHQGKAIDNGIGKRALITGGHFYINVFGDIFDSCDFSYETQREETPLGNIFDNFYKLLEIAEQVGDTEETEEEEEGRRKT